VIYGVAGGNQKEDGVARARRSTRDKLVEGEGPLGRVPPLAVFLVVVAVFVVGVLVGGVAGAVVLGALAAAIALLLAVTWDAMTPGQRFGRVLVLVLLIIIAVSRALVK
jgi:energy-coupling factor transporter transmembrane protein EcfT